MLLGKDAAASCSANTKQIVMGILTTPDLKQRLIDQLLRATLGSGGDIGSARVEPILHAFQSGLVYAA